MSEKDQFTLFEASLGSLKPRVPRLDRDRLMYLAGQSSVAYGPTYRTSSFRPVVASALVAAAVTLAVMTATQSGVRIVDSVAAAAASSEAPPAQPARSNRDAVEYRVEIGNSLGWIVSLLAGPQRAETDSARTEPNLMQLREQLLEENSGGNRSQKEEVRSTKAKDPNPQSPIPNPSPCPRPAVP